MKLVEQHPFLDRMLDEWGTALGPARLPYRGHAYRVLNYARVLLDSDRHDEELALAAAFHDVGIWSDGTFDYLVHRCGGQRHFAASEPRESTLS